MTKHYYSIGGAIEGYQGSSKSRAMKAAQRYADKDQQTVYVGHLSWNTNSPRDQKHETIAVHPKRKTNSSRALGRMIPAKLQVQRNGSIKVLVDQRQVRKVNPYYSKVEHFKPRFVPERLLPELSNLWHTSRVHSSSRYERMLYTSKWFAKDHPELTPTAVYKDLDAMLQFGGR